MRAEFEDVLGFWFPTDVLADPTKIVGQLDWWFRGGADAAILSRHGPLVERAARGDLDAWADRPRSRLALILVLDQFPRSLFKGSARAFAYDAQALSLSRSGIDRGDYDALATPWEKTFFLLPLSHSEDLANHDRAVALSQRLADEAAAPFRDILEFSAGQARAHRGVIARFGRHPHRNEVLERKSTAEELAYLESGPLVHQRGFADRLKTS
jgi:uncharacterized protein (DUF924 family)